MTVQSCRLRERPAQCRFEDMKFGMFMHWGLYAIPGRGEWVKFTENIPHDAYKELRSQFNPTEYNADAWAQIMQEGGMKYAVITARHHDGFSMFDTRHGREWSIMNTPYARDPMKSLAEACRKRGITLFFYYSLLDWTRPDYRSDFHHYLSFVNGQLAELCENYGKIGGIWFDGVNFIGDWHKWDLEMMIRTIKIRQPEALVCVNQAYLGHTRAVTLHGDVDFVTYECQDIQPYYQAGPKYIARETCQTIDRQFWGYNAANECKPTGELLELFLRNLCLGGNLLLNTGPDARGRIPEDHARGYRELGQWIAARSEAVYGTRPAGLTNGAWGGAVAGEDAVYLHIWNRPPDGKLSIESPARATAAVETLPDRREAAFTEQDGALVITLPPAPEGDATTVLKLTLTGEPRWSKVECEDYVSGGEGFGYHAPTTWTPAIECYRKDDIGCTLIDGELNGVSVRVRKGMSLLYHLDAPEAGTVRLLLRARGDKDNRATGQEFVVRVDRNARPAIEAQRLPVEDEAFGGFALGELTLDAGENYVTLHIDSGVGFVDYLKLVRTEG